MKNAWPLLAAIFLAGCAAVGTKEVLGTRPSYLPATTESVPNALALQRRMWVPGLDADYVPQGLTSAGPHLFVSSYKPTPDLKANTGPCRVFRIEIATGKPAGHFDIPPGTCTHAGGLGYAGGGKLFLADTRAVFLIDVDRALATGTSAGASKMVKITGELRGSYAAFDGTHAWIGTWTKDQPKARMFRLDPRLFDEHDGRTVDHALALESIPVPLEAQGAALTRPATCGCPPATASGVVSIAWTAEAMSRRSTNCQPGWKTSRSTTQDGCGACRSRARASTWPGRRSSLTCSTSTWRD